MGAAARPERMPRWTPEQDAMLLRLRGEGLGWLAISERLPGERRSAKAVADHHERLIAARATPRADAPRPRPITPRHKSGKWTAAEDAQILAALDAGGLLSALEGALNRSARAIQDRAALLRPELDTRPRRWTDAEEQQLTDLRAQGLRWAEIAARLRRSETACEQRYNGYLSGGRSGCDRDEDASPADPWHGDSLAQLWLRAMQHIGSHA